MTGNELFREIGMIKEEYVLEAQEYKRSIVHNVVFRRSVATAACLAVCFGLYWGIQSIGGASADCTQSNNTSAGYHMSAVAEDSDGAECAQAEDEAVVQEAEIFADAEEENMQDYVAVEEKLGNETSSQQQDSMSQSALAENDISEDKKELGERPGTERDLTAVKERLAAYPNELEQLCESDAYVIVHGTVENGQEQWDSFLNKVAAQESATIDLIQFTVEGDPIITYLHYNGEDFYMVEDSSRDAWAGSGAGMKESIFGYLNTVTEGNYVEVILSKEKDLTEEELRSGEYETHSLFVYRVEE